jgi:AraC-like DNA-binding protein
VALCDVRSNTFEGRLGELITTQVVRAYLDAFGSLEDLWVQSETEASAEALLDDSRGVPAATLSRISRLAMKRLAALDRQLIGREPLRPADWRVILYGLTGAKTLREALERGVDCFDVLDGRCGKMILRVRGDLGEIRLDSLRPTPTPAACLIDLFGVAEIHGLLSALIAGPLPLSRISLDHPRSVFANLGLPALAIPLDLDAGQTGFAFPAVYLDHPVVGSLPALLSQSPGNFLFGEGPNMQDSTDAEPIARQIRRIAMAALRGSRRLPSFDEIVAEMGVSAATLRRRLAFDATNYREIKDSCRRELALDLLRRSDLPIEDIASRLDYCDSDAFRRAFRDWLGMAPSEYRRHALAR